MMLRVDSLAPPEDLGERICAGAGQGRNGERPGAEEPDRVQERGEPAGQGGQRFRDLP